MSNSKKVKSLWKKAKSMDSLKTFVKTLEGDDGVVGEFWIANKHGASIRQQKEARRKLKGAKITAEALASKQARGK